MRRRGFTLIEVAAALAVTIAVVALSLKLGQQVIDYQAEELFLDRFTATWTQRRSGVLQRHEQALLVWSGQDFLFTGGGLPTIKLALPASMRGPVAAFSLKLASSGSFSNLGSFDLHRANGQVARFYFSPQWGTLRLTRNASA